MNAPSQTQQQHLSHRLGIVLAILYLLLVTAIYAVIALQPANDGLEWLPLFWLAMPWSGIGKDLLIPGILLNTVCLYAGGIVASILCRWIRQRGSPASPAA